MVAQKIAWMSRTLAPWCAAMGLLISFTADAGQETAQGASRNASRARAALMSDELVPARRVLAFDALIPEGEAMLPLISPLIEARLDPGAPQDLRSRPDEIPPKADLKPNVSAPPMVDRHAKGDPFVALRPTFEAKRREPGTLDEWRQAALWFGADERLPVSAFGAQGSDVTGPGVPDAFVMTSDSARLERRRPIAPSHEDGATPPPPRAVLLVATTPATPDVTPVTVGIAALHTAKPQSVVERAPDQPDFAALINPASAGDEEQCLAQAIYFEARSEPENGMAAVAQVVLNRVKSGLYPDSVCGVVFQNSNRYKACQFSFACEGKSLRVTELESWQTALRVARAVTDGRTWLADVGAATHYHATYVRPSWAYRLKRMDRIGHHVFYSLRNG